MPVLFEMSVLSKCLFLQSITRRFVYCCLDSSLIGSFFWGFLAVGGGDEYNVF